MVEIVEKQPSSSVPAWDQVEDVSTLTVLKFKALHRKLHAHKQHLEKVGPTMDIQRMEREVDDLRAKAETFRLTRLYKSLEAAEELKRKNVQFVGKLCTVIRDAETRQKEMTLPSQPDTSSQGSLNSTVRRRRFKQIWRENMDFLERLRNTGPAVTTADELATRYHVHAELVARKARFRRRNVRLLAVPPPEPPPRPKDPSSSSGLPHHMRPVRENLQTKLPPLKNRQAETSSVRPPKGDRSGASTASAPASARTARAKRTAAAPKALPESNDGSGIQDSEAVLVNEGAQAEQSEHTAVDGAPLAKEDAGEAADVEKPGEEQKDDDLGPAADRGDAEVGQGCEAETSEDRGEDTISQPADARGESLLEATQIRENVGEAEGGSQSLKVTESDMASEPVKAASKESAGGHDRDKNLEDQRLEETSRPGVADQSDFRQATPALEAAEAKAADPAEEAVPADLNQDAKKQDGGKAATATDSEHAPPHSMETHEATEGAQSLTDQAQADQLPPTASADRLLPPEASHMEKSEPMKPDDAAADSNAAKHTEDQEDEFEASDRGHQSAAASDEDEDGGFERSTSGFEQQSKQDPAGSAHVRQEAAVLAEEYGEDFEDEPQDPKAEASDSGHQSGTGSDEDEDDGGFERSTSGTEQRTKQDAAGSAHGRQEANESPEAYGEDFEDEPEAVGRKSTSSGDRGADVGKEALEERSDGQMREDPSSPEYSGESFEDDGQDASKTAGQEEKGAMDMQDDERQEEDEASQEKKDRGEQQDSEEEDDNDFEDDFEDNDEEEERQDGNETDEDSQSHESDDRASKSGSSEADPRQSDPNGGQQTKADEGNAYEDSDWEASEEDDNGSGPSSPASPAANKSQGASPQVGEYEADEDEFEESSGSSLSGSPVEATKSQSSWS